MKLILSDCPLSIPLPDREDVKWIDLSQLNIANCVGCFGCWTKTPGRCVIRDDAVKVYPIWCGSYDLPMKTMLERAIPVQQAFIRILDGETHHVQRSVVPKDATILAYGDTGEEERALFRKLVARNAHNMSFKTHHILFCREEEVNDFAGKELKAWNVC